MGTLLGIAPRQPGPGLQHMNGTVISCPARNFIPMVCKELNIWLMAPVQ